jgi:hypothetical protein
MEFVICKWGLGLEHFSFEKFNLIWDSKEIEISSLSPNNSQGTRFFSKIAIIGGAINIQLGNFPGST